ncbi:hypothetical protein P618_200265 [Holospora obtusa F1]|uniref:Tc1-like transposase DDE domain-containing protein n=1 Tax=Holospora obtusa F1 TaxID=1399147 RepID=W6TUV9_HOLOB|nr:hypothetical protein P618_200265 [Holospora obtusa F1]
MRHFINLKEPKNYLNLLVVGGGAPYSPNLNPIEKFWAHMKGWIRQHIEFCQGLYQSR